MFKGLNAELNPIRHFLSLLGVHHILHVSRIRVNVGVEQTPVPFLRITCMIELILDNFEIIVKTPEADQLPPGTEAPKIRRRCQNNLHNHPPT